MSPSQPESSQLFLQHQAMVGRIARSVHRRFRSLSAIEDLQQAGFVALMEAAARWQDRGTPFVAYAATRVRGAMVDHLRRLAGLRRKGAVSPPVLQSIDLSACERDSRFTDPADAVDTLIIKAQASAQLAAAIGRLPHRQALVLQLFFVDQLSLQAIGQVLGVGGARVCQIKAQALDQLARDLAHWRAH